jgi:uncharacterized lipoprotein YajG
MRSAPLLMPVLLLVCMTNTGCLLLNAEINPSYTADPLQTSRLKTLQPMTVALLIEDLRTSDERECVGQRRNGYGGVSAKVISGRPVTSIFYDALSAELNNNGHTVISEPSDATSRTVKVGVKRFWTENQMNFFDITMSATVDAEVVIQDRNAPATTMKRSITGTADESRQFAGESAYQDALNTALHEFVRSFARDSEIIKAFHDPATRQ